MTLTADLPARLGHPGDFTAGWKIPETDTTDPKFPDEGPRPPAQWTTVVCPYLELRNAL